MQPVRRHTLGQSNGQQVLLLIRAAICTLLRKRLTASTNSLWGGSESVFAGPGSGLNSPTQITFNGGNLFVANYYSSDILEFSPGGAATVFASTGGGYSNPLGLAFD